MARKKYRYNQHVHPTVRDMDVFCYIGRTGAATNEQLHRQFWSGRKMQTCQDRLDLLVKGGYLHTDEVLIHGEVKRMYWIERKASLLFDEQARQAFIRKQPPRAEIAHVIKTNDVLDALGRRFTVRTFTNEHALKSEKILSGARAQAADGRVVIENAQGVQQTFLLEIDGRYRGKYLRKKAHELAAAKAPILWVTYTKQRLQTLLSVCRAYTNIRPILYDTLL